MSASAETPAGNAMLEAWAIRYAPALRRYFQKRATASEAQDLVQEVFLRMQARTTTEPIQNIEGYLFRIAATVLVDRRRSHDGEPVSIDLDLLSGPAELREEISPERELLGKEAMELFIAAMEGLPPRTREAFMLHRFEEMTYAAIARKMGISVKTVEKLIARALRQLIECARAGS
jgi:RNA polymerase sigma-70 factor (ECF subfamily)